MVNKIDIPSFRAYVLILEGGVGEKTRESFDSPP